MMNDQYPSEFLNCFDDRDVDEDQYRGRSGLGGLSYGCNFDGEVGSKRPFPDGGDDDTFQYLAKQAKLIAQRESRKAIIKVLADAFNTANFDLLNNVLKTYCCPNCVFAECFVGQNNPFGPNYREFHGLTAIADYLHALMNIFPDAILNIHETKVRVRSQTKENVIVSRYSFSGTKLFDFTISQPGTYDKSFDTAINNQSHRLHRCANAVAVNNPGSVSVQATPKMDFFSKIKPDIKIVGTLSMPLNEDDKVVRFEFVYNNESELQQ